MLEVAEDRSTGAPGRTERARERAREDQGCDVPPRSTRAKATAATAPGAHTHTPPHPLSHTTPSPQQHPAPPSAGSVGLSSMHPSNAKVRNSPSAHTQSPKSKQEAMVRSPPVMSPSSAAQMDSKLPNQGKQGAGSQSQSSPCDPKALGGGHNPKAPLGGLGLKNGQSIGGGAKGGAKVKRERSTSAESYEQHDEATTTNDNEPKEMGSRAKRLCVSERRQPYSGADWCSGGETDEEDAGFYNCNSGEMKPEPSALSATTPTQNALGGQSSGPETGCGQKSGTKVCYIFTTEMANKAAEAVITGHADSLIAYHTSHISNGNKPTLPMMGPMGSGPKQSGAPPSSQPTEQNHQPASKPAAPGPQQPAPPSQPQASAPGTKPQDGPSSVGLDSKSIPGGSPQDGGSQEASTHPAGSTSEGNPPQGPGGYPPMELPKGAEGQLTTQQLQQQQHQQLSQELMSLGENMDGLSQEQLEHRERSLQTLRDIQRMLFPDDKDMAAMGPQGNMGGPPPNPMMEGPGGPKKPEQGPLQAMMAQSQSLGKPGGPRPDGPQFGPPGPRDMPFPEEPGPHCPHHGLPGEVGGETEQMAWLKLQQEFYEEKKRKQEIMMHPHGPRMMRGPPPPYQMNPGDGWGPGGPEPFPEQMGMGGPPRGMHPQMQRFPGMMNPEMDGGPHMPRPGMNWHEGDGRGFPQGMFGPGGPGGRVERFPNPQAVQEAMFQQGMGDKQGMMMDMNRMMGNPRHMEPGPGGMMFPRMPGEGPMSPSSRMEFVKGLSRGDMGDFGMGPGNMGMGPNPQMMNPKMGMSPEEMMKMRGGGGPMPENMGPQQKMMQGPPFPDQPHPGDFNMGPNRQFPPMNQQLGLVNVGRGPRGEPPFGPDQRQGPGGNGRMHPNMHPNQPPNAGPPPPPPNQRGGGRKQSEQAMSPGMNPLKSPPLRQVQSPMLASPSAGLKSPQTPSQLAGILTGTAPTSMATASASIKSPPIMGSAGASPVHMKSPSVPAPSPGWTSSPKPPLQSPGAPQGGKPPPNMMSSSEPGVPSSAPPSSSSSNQPGPGNNSMPSSGPYSMPPEPTLSQNPLSIMMSRMSKFAMPSSTPLYHDAIKTVASSDDDSPPARSPNLPNNNNGMAGMGMNQHPGHPRMMTPGSSGPMSALSPMGMNPMGAQPLPHGMPGQMPNQMPSPGSMGPGMPPHPGNMGPGGMMPQGMMMPPVHQDPGMMGQGRMGLPPHRGYPPGQSPPQHGPYPHNGPGPQGFPPGMGFPGEGGPMGRMGPGGGPEPGMCKPGGGGPEYGGGMGGVFDSDLQEVMRQGASGIPEFDLSRIMPSDKPSQTLSYFPRDGKPPPHHGGPPGFPPQMQAMMGDGSPRMMGGHGPMGPQDMPMGGGGHGGMRSQGFMGPGGMMGPQGGMAGPQGGMGGPQHRMLSPGQQQAMMGGPGMMQGKERGPIYNHPGPGGSPNMMMSLQGMGGPQQTMMMPQMRPRGHPGDMGMNFNPGPGNPGNMMF
ncbi:B-cell CLL/lymphoma 9 protein-like isoform X2 [Clupea harengus]|uniref:B-cell CLL/lymphoma 9 protein-like isoform X2 n=1 Tax=Clupea harengus TaxID=7950 RepID=A0A6P8EPE7_CLUHA|nr:B-cell CLL/lymphoma 9 protein-like isoform X2 [Clupea harengus]